MVFDSDSFFNIVKAAAISGILYSWVSFTKASLKTAWCIISSKDETWKPVEKQRVMCEECNEYFLDDLNDELAHEKLLCEACREGLVRDEFELKKTIFQLYTMFITFLTILLFAAAIESAIIDLLLLNYTILDTKKKIKEVRSRIKENEELDRRRNTFTD